MTAPTRVPRQFARRRTAIAIFMKYSSCEGRVFSGRLIGSRATLSTAVCLRHGGGRARPTTFDSGREQGGSRAGHYHLFPFFVAKRSNMIVRPGGAQTRVKLGIVGDYLKRFARASQRARDRIYIDGLAGSGTGIDPRTGQLYDGSARRCLDVEPPLHRGLPHREGQGPRG